MMQSEPLQKVDKPVTEEAEVDSKGASQISSVLEELTSCFESEFVERGKCETNSLDVVNVEYEEEDLEEETESVADVLDDFFSIPNVDEEDGTSVQHEPQSSCDQLLSIKDSKNQDIAITKSSEGESILPTESEANDPEVTLEVNLEIQSKDMDIIRDESVGKSKISEEVSTYHKLETCSSKVTQSPSKPQPLISPTVKEDPRDAIVLADSESEPNSPKFDWMRDVSSKIIISGQYYECAECGLKNREQREILDHLSDFHLQRFREFTCMICRIPSQSLRDFLDHLKTEHKKKPSRDFKRAVTENYDIGGKRKIIEVDLEAEVNDETLPKKSKCPTYDHKKREEEVMENHLKMLEDQLSKKDSPKEKNMRETQSQNQHQPFNWHREMTKSVAITKNKIKCLQCSAQLGSSNSAVSHLESFHFKELKNLKCPHCDIICDNLVNYNSHVRMKHRVKLTLSLNKKTLTAIDESSSMALINESLVYNTSTTRPDGFLWQNEVMKRIKLSRDIYHCSDCDFKTKPLSGGGGVEILNHIEAQHMGITGYSCPECRTVVNNFINFFQHLNKSHKIRLKLLQIL